MQNTKSDCSSRFCFTCERKICAENSVLIIELKSSPNLKHYRITQRRDRDSNPRNHISSSTDFESAPFDHSGISPFPGAKIYKSAIF